MEKGERRAFFKESLPEPDMLNLKTYFSEPSWWETQLLSGPGSYNTDTPSFCCRKRSLL